MNPARVGRSDLSRNMEMMATARRCYRRLPEGVRKRLRWIKHADEVAMRQLIRAVSRERVAAGPFRGVRYVWPSYQDLACTLGTYEREIYPALESVMWRPFPLVVDIGAASGYYVVGLAARYPAALVVAYEASRETRRGLERNIKANGLCGQVEVRGFCAPADLSATLAGRGPALLIVDVEGFETELLDPDRIPALCEATILLETHDAFVPGSSRLIRARFEGSHSIRLYRSTERTLNEFPFPWVLAAGIPARKAALHAMWEYREGTQEWLLLTPHHLPTR